MEAKFRPSLSESEITEILDMLDQTQGNESLKRKLRIFLKKAECGITQPGFVAQTSKLSIAEKLELSISNSETPAQKREAAYLLYQRFMGNAAVLGEDIIKLARTYMFENDMLSPEEETEFLAGH